MICTSRPEKFGREFSCTDIAALLQELFILHPCTKCKKYPVSLHEVQEVSSIPFPLIDFLAAKKSGANIPDPGWGIINWTWWISFYFRPTPSRYRDRGTGHCLSSITTTLSYFRVLYTGPRTRILEYINHQFLFLT